MNALVAAAGAPSDVVVAVRSEAPLGAGLGSSGAAAVAIVAALRAWVGDDEHAPEAIARAAVQAEGASGVVGGRQDQYAAAFGFVRSYVFDGERCEITPHATAAKFECELLVVRAPGTRRSSTIVADVVDAYKRGQRSTRAAIERLHLLAPQTADVVERGSPSELAMLFREILRAQLDLHPSVADPSLVELVELIKPINHVGAKLLGAGGIGGSLLVVCPPNACAAVLQAAAHAGCSTLPLRFARTGIQVNRLQGARL